jgi:hypothetical protein
LEKGAVSASQEWVMEGIFPYERVHMFQAGARAATLVVVGVVADRSDGHHFASYVCNRFDFVASPR